MRKLLIALACSYILVLGFTPKHMAQEPDQQNSPQNKMDSPDQYSRRIYVSMEEIISLSETKVVPTIVENGIAYAIGFVGDALFKTKVHERVSRAYGISLGTLAFSKPMPTSASSSSTLGKMYSFSLLE